MNFRLKPVTINASAQAKVVKRGSDVSLCQFIWLNRQIRMSDGMKLDRQIVVIQEQFWLNLKPTNRHRCIEIYYHCAQQNNTRTNWGNPRENIMSALEQVTTETKQREELVAVDWQLVSISRLSPAETWLIPANNSLLITESATLTKRL